MILEYKSEKVFTKDIDIEDVGNTCLRCANDDYSCEYYIATSTICGKTFILKFGPVIPDIDFLTDNFMLTHKKIDYNVKFIIKEINLLINDAKKDITNVEEISTLEVAQAIPNFNTFFDIMSEEDFDDEN